MTRWERLGGLSRYVPPIALAGFVAAFFVLPSNREVNKLFYFVVLPLLLLTARRDDYVTVWKNPTFRAALLYVGYLSVTVLWSGLLLEAASRESLIDALCVLGFLLLIVSACRRAELNERVALWFVSLTTAHALVVMIIWYSTHSFGERMLGLGRLDHPLQLATVQAAAGAIAAVWFMNDRSVRSRWLALVPAICCVSIMLTASRGPLLALTAVIVGSALLLRTRRALLLTTAVVVLVGAALVLEPRLLDVLGERGASFRPVIWTAAWDRIDDALWWGHGLGSPSTIVISGYEVRHFHNVVLMAWYYGGLIAVALLLVMIGTAARAGLRNALAWPWLAALTAGLFCQFLNGDTVLTHPHPAWLYVWFPLAMLGCAMPPTEMKTPEGLA